jgi:hypothetical protein
MALTDLTVIAVDISNDIGMLRPVHYMDFLAHDEIHLIHAVTKVVFIDDTAINVIAPTDQNEELIKKSVIAKMKDSSSEILPYGHNGKVKFDCFFSLEPKNDFCRYLVEMKASLAIVSTRSKHGLFESSFARYLSGHAKCSVLVIKTGEGELKNFRKVVVGVKFDEDKNDIDILPTLIFLKNADIHLIHMSKTVDYNIFPEINLPYIPYPEQKIVIEQAVITRLNKVKERLVAEGFKGKISSECVFSKNLKQDFCHLATQHQANLTIVMAKKKRSFLPSFIQYQLVHSNIPILIIKHGN